MVFPFRNAQVGAMKRALSSQASREVWGERSPRTFLLLGPRKCHVLQGKVSEIKARKTANYYYSVTLLFICDPLELLI